MLLVFAFGIFSFAVSRQHLAIESMHWPMSEGTVTSSKLQTRTSAKFGKLYVPVIQYEYRVGGKQFQGNVIKFDLDAAFGQSAPEAQKRVEYYHSGDTVRVFHDVMHPELSCLEPGGDWFRLSVFVICSAVLIFCAALVCIVDPLQYSANISPQALSSRLIKTISRRPRSR